MQTASFWSFRGPGRIAISRSVPKDLPIGYHLFRELAPGPWFQDVDYDRYLHLYRTTILDRLDPQETWGRLHMLADGAEPVLLCYERAPLNPPAHYCHRRMVADWFRETLGHDVPEMMPGKPSSASMPRLF